MLTLPLQELVKKYEQNVSDHESYDNKYNTAQTWVTDAQARFLQCDSPLSTHADLQTKQTIVQVSDC